MRRLTGALAALVCVFVTYALSTAASAASSVQDVIDQACIQETVKNVHLSCVPEGLVLNALPVNVSSPRETVLNLLQTCLNPAFVSPAGRSAPLKLLAPPVSYASWTVQLVLNFALKSGVRLNVTQSSSQAAYERVLRASAVSPWPAADGRSHDLWILDASAWGDIMQYRKLADLEALATYDSSLRWNSMQAGFRLHIVRWDSRVVGIILKAQVIQLYYRLDVFQRDQVPRPPRTWDEALALAQQYNGTGDKADPLWGFCLQPSGCGLDGRYLGILAASMIQVGGPGSGLYYDPSTMEPLIGDNAATAEALRLLRALRALSPPDGACGSAFVAAFAAGRCLMTLDTPFLFKTVSYKSSKSPLRGTLGVAAVPGSTRVLNRTSHQLINCTASLCPMAKLVSAAAVDSQPPPPLDVPLMNSVTPASATLGCINAFDDIMHQFYAYSLISYFVGTPLSVLIMLLPSSDVYPVYVDHFDVQLWVSGGYNADDAARFLANYRRATDSANMVVPPRFANASDYEAAVDAIATAFSAPGSDLDTADALQALFNATSALVTQGGYSMRQSYLSSINANAAPQAPVGPLPSPAPPPVVYAERSDAVVTAITVPTVVVGAVLVGLALWLLVPYLLKGRRGGKWVPVVAPGVGPDTTLVITDIEKSTMLWEALPSELMNHCLSLHDRLIRQCLAKWHGYESFTEGDSFTAAFAKPTDALGFAVDVQQHLLDAEWPALLLKMPYAGEVWVEPCQRLALTKLPSSRQHRGGLGSRPASRVLSRLPSWYRRSGSSVELSTSDTAAAGGTTVSGTQVSGLRSHSPEHLAVGAGGASGTTFRSHSSELRPGGGGGGGGVVGGGGFLGGERSHASLRSHSPEHNHLAGLRRHPRLSDPSSSGVAAAGNGGGGPPSTAASTPLSGSRNPSMTTAPPGAAHLAHGPSQEQLYSNLSMRSTTVRGGGGGGGAPLGSVGQSSAGGDRLTLPLQLQQQQQQQQSLGAVATAASGSQLPPHELQASLHNDDSMPLATALDGALQLSFRPGIRRRWSGGGGASVDGGGMAAAAAAGLGCSDKSIDHSYLTSHFANHHQDPYSERTSTTYTDRASFSSMSYRLSGTDSAQTGGSAAPPWPYFIASSRVTSSSARPSGSMSAPQRAPRARSNSSHGAEGLPPPPLHPDSASQRCSAGPVLMHSLPQDPSPHFHETCAPVLEGACESGRSSVDDNPSLTPSDLTPRSSSAAGTAPPAGQPAQVSGAERSAAASVDALLAAERPSSDIASAVSVVLKAVPGSSTVGAMTPAGMVAEPATLAGGGTPPFTPPLSPSGSASTTTKGRGQPGAVDAGSGEGGSDGDHAVHTSLPRFAAHSSPMHSVIVLGASLSPADRVEGSGGYLDAPSTSSGPIGGSSSSSVLPRRSLGSSAPPAPDAGGASEESSKSSFRFDQVPPRVSVVLGSGNRHSFARRVGHLSVIEHGAAEIRIPASQVDGGSTSDPPDVQLQDVGGGIGDDGTVAAAMLPRRSVTAPLTSDASGVPPLPPGGDARGRDVSQIEQRRLLLHSSTAPLANCDGSISMEGVGRIPLLVTTTTIDSTAKGACVVGKAGAATATRVDASPRVVNDSSSGATQAPVLDVWQVPLSVSAAGTQQQQQRTTAATGAAAGAPLPPRPPPGSSGVTSSQASFKLGTRPQAAAGGSARGVGDSADRAAGSSLVVMGLDHQASRGGRLPAGPVPPSPTITGRQHQHIVVASSASSSSVGGSRVNSLVGAAPGAAAPAGGGYIRGADVPASRALPPAAATAAAATAGSHGSGGGAATLWGLAGPSGRWGRLGGRWSAPPSPLLTNSRMPVVSGSKPGAGGTASASAELIGRTAASSAGRVLGSSCGSARGGGGGGSISRNVFSSPQACVEIEAINVEAASASLSTQGHFNRHDKLGSGLPAPPASSSFSRVRLISPRHPMLRAALESAWDFVRVAASFMVTERSPSQAQPPALEKGVEEWLLSPRRYEDVLRSSWRVVAPPDLPSSPDKQLAFRGLRVRIGLHSGIHDQADIVESRSAVRTKYSGAVLMLARIVSSAPPGGIISLSGECVARLSPQWLHEQGALMIYQGRQQLYYDVLPLDMYSVFGSRLTASRMALVPSWPQANLVLLPGTAKAPVHAAVLIKVQVVGAAALLAWDLELGGSALVVFADIVDRWLEEYGGVLVELAEGGSSSISTFAGGGSGAATAVGLALLQQAKGGSSGTSATPSASSLRALALPVVAAFSSVPAAMLWVLNVQQDMLHHDWHPSLLAHELCEELWLLSPEAPPPPQPHVTCPPPSPATLVAQPSKLASTRSDLVPPPAVCSAVQSAAGTTVLPRAATTGSHPSCSGPRISPSNRFSRFFKSARESAASKSMRVRELTASWAAASQGAGGTGGGTDGGTLAPARSLSSRQGVWMRGPRIKAVMDVGLATAELNPITGRVSYQGRMVAHVQRMMSKAQAGQIVCSARFRRLVDQGHRGAGVTVPDLPLLEDRESADANVASFSHHQVGQ